MPKMQLLALLLCSAALTGTGAMADIIKASADAQQQSSAAQGDFDEAATRRVLEQFRTVRVPLSQAMAIAERLHEGSKTADVSFEISGPAVYRVRTVRNDRIYENVIDANAGSVSQDEIASSLKDAEPAAALRSGLEWAFDLMPRRRMAGGFVNSRRQLRQAFTKAQIGRRRPARDFGFSFGRLRTSRGNIVLGALSKPAGIHDHRDRDFHLCVDADRRQRGMRGSDSAR